MQDDDTDGTTGTGAGDTQSVPPVVSDDDTTGGDTSSTGEPDPPTDDDTSSSDGGFIPGPDMGTTMGLPLGEMCESDRDCDSEACFQIVPGYGFCSQCSLDADCMIDGGPGTCGFTGAQPFAICTDGGAGEMCQSSAGCQPDLLCVALFEGSSISYCSECETDATCENDLLCTPTFQQGHVCVMPGSGEEGDLCPPEGTSVCASGHCTQATANGNPTSVWLCGACTIDEDCEEGQTCQAATLSMVAIMPSVCV